MISKIHFAVVEPQELLGRSGLYCTRSIVSRSHRTLRFAGNEMFSAEGVPSKITSKIEKEQANIVLDEETWNFST